MADRNLRIRMLLEASDRFTRPLRDLAGGSTKAAASLKAMRDRLKDIDRAQKDIGAFRDLKGGMKAAGVELDAARARVTALGRALAETETPGRKLRTEFNRAKREAAGLETQYQANSTRLGELRERLRAAGIATTDLVRHERALRQEAGRTNQALSEQGRRMQQLNDRTRRLSAARAGFGRNMGMATGALASGAAGVGAGMAVAAPLGGAVKGAMEYQSVMTDIAQKANLTREEARKMGLGLIAAAKAANQLPTAMQEGVDTLAGFGLDPRKAVAMMRPIGRAATAYKAEIKDLSAAAFAANDNLKVPIGQTAKVIDIMASAGKAGAFEIKDMAGQFPALTAAYQALGQKGTRAVADLAAGAQIARKGAGDAETAGNNLLNLLNKISGKETNDRFKKFGIDLPAALKKAAAAGKGPIEAITELTDKALKGDRSKLSYLFGDMQVQAALRPLLENLGEFRKIRDEAMNAKGVTDTDFAERLKDGAEQSKRFEIASKALGLTLGSVLLPAATSLMTRAAALANSISVWADRNPRAARAVIMLAAAVAGLLFVFGGAAITLAAMMAPFAALSFVATALGVGLLPVIGIAAGVVAGILALGAAAYAIYANWGAISGFFTGIGTSIRATFNDLTNWLGGTLVGQLAGIGRNLILGLIGGITGMLGQLKATIVGAASSAATWFKQKLGIHSPSRVFAGFGGFMMTGLRDGIDGSAGGPVRSIDRMARRLTDAMPKATAAGSPIARVEDLGRQIATAVSIAAAVPAAAGPAPRSGSASAARAAASPTQLGPIEIHIHQQPGQSAPDLARMVRDEVNRLRREDQARQRSSFSDSYDG
jgi:TP901 family phage tail tape measure protein